MNIQKKANMRIKKKAKKYKWPVNSKMTIKDARMEKSLRVQAHKHHQRPHTMLDFYLEEKMKNRRRKRNEKRKKEKEMTKNRKRSLTKLICNPRGRGRGRGR
ncbi:hypothetical protein V6Z11_A01G040300 [Gossypium hirsutum]